TGPLHRKRYPLLKVPKGGMGSHHAKTTINLSRSSSRCISSPGYKMILEDSLMELVEDIRSDGREDIAVGLDKGLQNFSHTFMKQLVSLNTTTVRGKALELADGYTGYIPALFALDDFDKRELAYIYYASLSMGSPGVLEGIGWGRAATALPAA
ncbi:hypothetical protein H0H92_010304, partial [Tricholoma furcatifolium]